MAVLPSRDGVFCDIIQANPDRVDAVYEVRVLKKWEEPDQFIVGRLDSMKLVLIDQHFHKIQATIPSDLISKFDHQVVEGGVYEMSSFSVDFNFDSLLPSHHRYKFVFNENTKVVPSNNNLLPKYGLSLIGAENILKRRLYYRYMVDVVGVLTSVQHDKNFFPDGKVTQSVTLQLDDQRRSLCCELSGRLVDEFKKSVDSSAGGLPVVVLQFMKITISQGCTLVEGIEGVTRIFVDPSVPDVEKFRSGMDAFLRKNIDYSGLSKTTRLLPLSHTLDFIDRYPVRTIAELRIFQSYIGSFHCQKCKVRDFCASPKVKITLELDDESGTALFSVFDHVMIGLAAPALPTRGVNVDYFYKAFSSFMGKSVMFVVKKKLHNADHTENCFELVRASAHPSVIKYFIDVGVYTTPSKNIEKRPMKKSKQDEVSKIVRCTSTISELVDEYLTAAAANFMSSNDGASSSRIKRTRV
ncbi:hypothetical protein TSUD_300280 [Trifolium subterraneum]|uniref:Replication protein A 70 kDa DNA-binding subunit B/D first OB fold domain-containing protein n=1 Tax=Trifolium subterraneum TaxID=3900 RepID=A0A2Z6P1W5_TRISU|nr:hypothetical protein TSUD_300280 [Trifolium subterraneum]